MQRVARQQPHTPLCLQESAGIGMVFTACATVCIVGAAWTVAFVSDRESSSLDAEGDPVEYVGDKDEEPMLEE